jgi:flavin reductase (DIM6/NTAB) family NADH-FMN oxidoreductase RutF
MECNTNDFKAAFAILPSGVALVSCIGEAGPVGMTISSLSSLSLDPKLLVWCAAKSSLRTSSFSKAEHTVIQIFSDAQADTALAFAQQGLEPFEALDYTVNQHSIPVISNCCATFYCSSFAEYDGGDHIILTARVDHAETTNNSPLVYCGGDFQKLIFK